MINNKSQKGFTLAEMIVSIGIIVLLLSFALVGYRQRGEAIALQREVQRVAGDIELAREMGMSSPDPYGIYLSLSDPKHYILFVDSNDNKVYDGVSERINQIELENGVYIKNLSFSPLYISFKSPSPEVRLESAFGSVENATITLSIKSNASKTKTITINSVGLVNTQ
jgi:prepilin-type N-terminal cleavage/methylation domain-containing protein